MKAVFIVHGEGRLSLFWAFALCCLRAVIPLVRPDDLGHMDVKTRGGGGRALHHCSGFSVWVAFLHGAAWRDAGAPGCCPFTHSTETP